MGGFLSLKRKNTEMKAVFSMDIKGIISTSCWQEISSSSGGVTETRRDCGSAMFFTDLK